MFFWKDAHHVCISGMPLIMHAFLERPSSCMLFWNDPHHVCFSGMTLIMYAFLERPSSGIQKPNTKYMYIGKTIPVQKS
jgi:hypothetical protein